MYVDGADEINHTLQMIKGGGAALLAEKIVASAADRFVCVADESKYVSRLGKFPLPIEVIPLSRSLVSRRLVALGGDPELRLNCTTASGHQIVDVRNLDLSKPLTMEEELNKIPGVVENGLFARHPADVLVLGTQKGVEVFTVG